MMVYRRGREEILKKRFSTNGLENGIAVPRGHSVNGLRNRIGVSKRFFQLSRLGDKCICVVCKCVFNVWVTGIRNGQAVRDDFRTCAF